VPIRSWQRDIDVQQFQRRATCQHDNDAQLRTVHAGNPDTLDDHTTDICYCAQCGQYVYVTSWRCRPETEAHPLPFSQQREWAEIELRRAFRGKVS
jgi:hypothetical protein